MTRATTSIAEEVDRTVWMLIGGVAKAEVASESAG